MQLVFCTKRKKLAGLTRSRTKNEAGRLSAMIVFGHHGLGSNLGIAFFNILKEGKDEKYVDPLSLPRL